MSFIFLRQKFSPESIFNVDETGATTVQTPKSIMAEKGRKQLGSVVSAERGQLVTLVCTINAIGNSIPPPFIFPQVIYKNYFINGVQLGHVVPLHTLDGSMKKFFVMYIFFT